MRRPGSRRSESRSRSRSIYLTSHVACRMSCRNDRVNTSIIQTHSVSSAADRLELEECGSLIPPI